MGPASAAPSAQDTSVLELNLPSEPLSSAWGPNSMILGSCSPLACTLPPSGVKGQEVGDLLGTGRRAGEGASGDSAVYTEPGSLWRTPQGTKEPGGLGIGSESLLLLPG